MTNPTSDKPLLYGRRRRLWIGATVLAAASVAVIFAESIAARAGTETVYWWGNEKQPGVANCIGCDSRWGSKQPVPVGSFKPNSFGLYDTAGNVLEWVQDCWHDNYQGAPSDGSAWEKEHNGDCDGRVRRGGSYIGDARSSSRGLFRAGARFRALGFRLVREIE